MKTVLSVDLSNSFGSLPNDFFVKMNPEIMPDLKLIRLNETLCEDLGLQPDQLKEQAGVNFLGGKNILSNQNRLLKHMLATNLETLSHNLVTEELFSLVN